MVIVSVLYPKTSESRFDHTYYLRNHMPLVRSRWEPMGLMGDSLMRGSATLDAQQPPFELIGLLRFESSEKVEAALAAFGAEILEDIPNFTNVSPIIQMNEPV